MDWIDLRTALAVFEAQSHAGAARTLGVSQPTVSRRIKTLEAAMGRRLFQRTPQGLKPTELGLVVIERAQRMQIEAAALDRAVSSLDVGARGRVTIAAADGVGNEWLPYALAPLLSAHPSLDTRTVIGMEAANIAAGEADIALRWIRPGQQHSLIARRVVTAGGGLYASKGYLDRHPAPQSLAELSDAEGVGWVVDTVLAWPRSNDGVEVAPARQRYRASSPTDHVAALRCGLGVGVTSHRLALAGPEPLIRVLPDHEVRMELWVVSHPDMRLNAAHRLVHDHLIDALAADRAHFDSGAVSVFPKA